MPSKASDDDHEASYDYEDHGGDHGKNRACIAERIAKKISSSNDKVDKKLLKLLEVRQKPQTVKPKTTKLTKAN